MEPIEDVVEHDVDLFRRFPFPPPLLSRRRLRCRAPRRESRDSSAQSIRSCVGTTHSPLLHCSRAAFSALMRPSSVRDRSKSEGNGSSTTEHRDASPAQHPLSPHMFTTALSLNTGLSLLTINTPPYAPGSSLSSLANGCMVDKGMRGGTGGRVVGGGETHSVLSTPSSTSSSTNAMPNSRAWRARSPSGNHCRTPRLELIVTAANSSHTNCHLFFHLLTICRAAARTTTAELYSSLALLQMFSRVGPIDSYELCRSVNVTSKKSEPMRRGRTLP